MPFLNDRVLDNGLTVLDTEADKLTICSAEQAYNAAAPRQRALPGVDTASKPDLSDEEVMTIMALLD